MFRRKTNKDNDIYNYVFIDGTKALCDEVTFKYVNSLIGQKEMYRKRARDLELELKAIKPVVESKSYRPAISKDCGECKYVLRSTYNADIIGCRIENVCEKFERKN